MEQRGSEKGFGPVAGPGSRALILGSYPSPKSFDDGFYYGHPRNRFWPLLASFAGVAAPATAEEKKSLILRSHLALWDVLESCRILGASDASIKDPVPNDIAALLARFPIRAVFCNGAAAHKFYRRYCQPQTGLAATVLPSTSPANAAFTMKKLAAAWQPVKAYIKGTAPPNTP